MELTNVQYRVADKITRGLSQKEIADDLCVSPHTIKNHIANICKKTNARSSVDIARKFILSLENPKQYFSVIALLFIQFQIMFNCLSLDLRTATRPPARKIKTSRKIQ